ncbi:unnamed protein product [Mortierella alpina]
MSHQSTLLKRDLSGTSSNTVTNTSTSALIYDHSSQSFTARDICALMIEREPHVLIVGAGLSGLLLAILLEKANISYEVFERRKDFRPVGSAVSIPASVLPIVHVPDKVKDKAVESHGLYIIVPRPCLYHLLYNQIPPHKLRTSKRIVSLLQDHEGVMIRAADCTSYHGDILVGADGASSSVRQELNKSLEKKGIRQKFAAISHNILCGVTGPLDPKQYPGVDDEHSNVTFIQSKSTPHSWATFTVRNNAICCYDLMAKEVYEFKTIYGKLGDLIDQTPRESLDGQSLETALFDIWYHGRTVLIGDAVHHAAPFNSASTLHAIHDAVGLANRLYDIKHFSYHPISAALKDFTDLRFPQMRAHFIQESMNAGSNKKLFIHNVLRKLMSGRLLGLAAMRKHSQETSNPLRCKFLPLTPKGGQATMQSPIPSQHDVQESYFAQYL